MIGKGSIHNNLYILESTQAFSNTPALSISQNHSSFQVSTEVWHQRLGHPSFNKIHSLSKELNISLSKDHHNTLCKICPLAKQKRLSFPSSPHISSNPFDLLHLDVWGPFHEPTPEGYKYFLTIDDDCTRATWVYLLTKKLCYHYLP